MFIERTYLSGSVRYNRTNKISEMINMHALANAKAISNLGIIILMLGSAIFGGIISYMWVISNFYLEPRNTVDLVITDAKFPVNHADFFNITAMNPSHSPSATNITQIYFTVEGDNGIYNVTKTNPGLPISLEKGTFKTIKCFPQGGWGQFAGKTITVHVIGTNATGAIRSVKTKYVKLETDVDFNAAVSCKRFNVTVENDPYSAINLTLKKIYINWQSPENITLLPERENITLPMTIPIRKRISLQCFYDWETLVNPMVRIETSEGYIVEKRANASASVLLLISDVRFNETNPDEMSLKISNSAESSTLVDVSRVVLTYDNGTQYSINANLRINRNESVTFNCHWPWKNYRDRNVTITAYTKQGFASPSKTVKTPPQVVWKIADVNCDLGNTTFFWVDVTNMPCSLYEINVTGIDFNSHSTNMTSLIIFTGDQKVFTCEYNWTSFVGKNANITVHVLYKRNESSSISYSLTLPYFKIVDVSFSSFLLGNPYVNITVCNSEFSTINATITEILIETENGTYLIDGTLTNPQISPNGYELTKGMNVTIVCPWNWRTYSNQEVTVRVHTADGCEATKTVIIPSS